MTDWTLYSMFVLGLFGTAHCLGMCGPLVLALPARRGRIRSHLLYHGGRITTYSVVGGVLGALGAQLMQLSESTNEATMSSLASVQVALAIVAVVVLVWLGLTRFGWVKEPQWMTLASPSGLPGLSTVQQRAKSGGDVAMFVLGLMLGLLPCGLSFAAFATALPAGGALAGAGRVFAFGMGTLPGLLLLGTVASRFARRHRRVFDTLSGILLIGMAVWITIKGLGRAI